MEPISATAVFACINTCFKFAEYAVRVAEVGTENEVFVRTIQVVRNDLNETERLLLTKSVQAKLISTPYKLQWIKSSVHSTKSALNEIGRWVERARGEQHATGNIKFETRVRWVFNDHEKLINRQHELSMCHQQLSNVLNYLIPLEEPEVTAEPPTYDNTTCFDDLLSPRQRRASTMKNTGYPAVPPSGSTSLPNNTVNFPNHSPYAENVVPRKVAPAGVMALTAGVTKPSSTLISKSYAGSPYMSSGMDPMTDASSPPYIPPPVYSATPVHGWIDPQVQACSRAQMDPYSAKYGEVKVGSSSLTAGKVGGGRIAISESGMEKSEVWAHECRREKEIPELQGDTVSFSATNLGPVNPFELFAGPTTAKSRPMPTSAVAEPNCIETLSEAVGDISFAVELPVNTPGNVPAYPPISNNLAISELPSEIPKRRPLPSRAVTSPLGAVHELSVQHQPGEYVSLFCQELPSATFSGVGVAGIAHDNPDTSPQWTHASRHSSVPSMSSPMMAPFSSAPSPLTTPILGNVTHIANNQHIVSPLITPAVPLTQSLECNLQRTATAASSRMQRQRSFMDMLGAIDQS